MNGSEKKLFLLDAMALIYRAHFAFSKNPRITSTGINSSAVFGFTNSLLEVLYKEKPTHIGVAIDTAGPTFRHESFVEYKANRQEQPEDITIAIPYITRLLEAFQIPLIGIPGYEADDVIGTLSSKACKEGYTVYMLTMDKDYSQLVNDCVYLYKPSYMGNGHEVYDVARVLEKFGIKRVDQVRDILGLMGDSVDNIPGIPGIGEKTAQKLIAEYDTVENLIANADNLKGKLKENVVNFGPQGILSKELATIHCDVPVAFDDELFRYKEPLKEELSKLFDELEFKTLKKRVFGEDASAVQQASSGKSTTKVSPTGQMSMFGNTEEEVLTEEQVEGKVFCTIKDTVHDYRVIDTPELIASLVSYLKVQDEFCFDTETTSLDAAETDLVGLAFSYYKGEAYYVPVPQNFEKAKAIVEAFRDVLEDKKITKIGQNLKFDILVLKRYGIDVDGPVFDTMLAHYLIEPDMRHNMDFMSEHYLNYSPVSIETLIGKKGVKQKNMKDVPLKDIAEYAAEDADITLQLKHILQPILKEQKTEKLFGEVEIPLLTVLADVERAGVKINPDALKEFSKQLDLELLDIEKSIFNRAGCEFNIASPKQLGEVLFERLKIDPKAKKTKTGQYATGEEVLSKLAPEHLIAQEILDYRELQKLKSTYVDTLPLLISKVDGRVHTCYNQAVAATGRLSSTNPNLQNIPIRTDRGKEIRKAFVARDSDHLILSADYSQIELRIMAEFSKEKNMIEAFQKGIDIHTTTASKVYKVSLDQVTSDMRRNAKMVNFGIIYGISAFGLSQRLDIPRKEAADIIDAYFNEFPAIKSYMDEVINKAREHEYVETILGRRRYLRDINSRNITQRGYAERNAINAPIQGSAADMIKVAMINIHNWMKQENLKSRMIMQVHDELVFDAHKSEVEVLKLKVEEFMKTALPMSVPMEIGIGVGENWLEAH
ncbi:MAG: DNA polymerase I [Sporocytophaga sp.]|uniref:DNA polymerase I n=1 Tax=Sporocytophaga sp. TaxID=2231183 RepID=UPI001B1168B2|nr:DNA polymerase I [Sporocytophaga sp.]MBO9701994.1 DNA polymerase I [Sporocytophaga sp.]